MSDLDDQVLRLTGAAAVGRRQRLQTLWGGYGQILRVPLVGAAVPSVIVKQVVVPTGAGGHADGGSHARKLRSYDVESSWYRDWSARCGDGCRVPRSLGLGGQRGRWWFVLEDLDAAGFPGRRHGLTDTELDRCLAWLAHFHGTFLDRAPDGLWPVGTYWHLATRPLELDRMGPGALRRAARGLDAALSGARFQTLVHGDAKPANFCFGRDAVAAVDFQYVGGGCGMKDVAYLLGGSIGARGLARNGDRHLDRYFAHLDRALGERGVDSGPVEAEWRALYPVAWADFERFMAGWSPGHRARDRYSEGLIAQALAGLEGAG